ncbi:MAG: DUF4140 domain-containing protein, partial [Streptomyces sp.]|nr:DUF4140 domain-containing protein [Streptomyces sp.]
MGASTRETAVAGQAVTSEVTSVVVYSAGAICTRRARFALPAGDGPLTVRVTGLSPALLEESLRCAVAAGPDGLRVTDIRVEYGVTLRRGDELPRLQLDLEDAQDRQARVRDRAERLKAEIAETAALRAEPPAPRRGDPPRWAPVESILALASFVDSRLATLHRRLREAEQELEQADHDVDLAHHRIAEASSALDPGHTTPSATALLFLSRDGALTGGAPADGTAGAQADGRPAPDDSADD